MYFPPVPWRGRREDKEKKVGPHFSLPREGWWWGGRGEPRKKCPKYEDAAFCLQLFATEKVIREDRERLPTMLEAQGRASKKKEVRVLHGG
jgi:hypothetical protein